jgi:hypothetical protein
LNGGNAWVDWGDGPLTADWMPAKIYANLDGTYFVAPNQSHVYLREGTYHVTVSVYSHYWLDLSGVHPSYGPALGTADITVAEVPAQDVSLRASSAPLSATEGSTLAGPLASFTSADPSAAAGDFSAVVSWGDGTPAQAAGVSGAAGNFSVQGSHAYPEAGSYELKVTVTDHVHFNGQAMGDLTSTTQTTVRVDDPPLSAQGGSPLSATAGVALGPVVLASFTDPNTAGSASAYAAAVEWGDGGYEVLAVSGSGGAYQVQGSHTYAAPGQYTARLVLREGGVPRTVVSCAINVAPASVPQGRFVVQGLRLETVEGAALDGVTVATFHNNGLPLPSGCAELKASIDWGDGTISDGVIRALTGQPGQYEVTGSHS